MSKPFNSIKITLLSCLFILCRTVLNAPASSGTELNEIPDVLISLESGTEPEYAIVVEKQTQQLTLLAYDGAYKKLYSFNCSTGEVPGKKQKSGDKKTPEGVYFFTGSFEKKYLSAVYGDWAFPMDYPNLMDRIHGHDGNSIWMHGSDKPIKPRNSNGCIVLANDHINTLSKYITINKTPIIVTKQLSFVTPKINNDIKDELGGFIDNWHTALNTGTYNEYRAFYDPDYVMEINWWSEWNELKNFLKEKDSSFTISLKPVSILNSDGTIVALYDQAIQTDGHGDIPAGSRKVYIEHKDNAFMIIGDEYLKSSNDQEDINPLLAACDDFKSYMDAEQEISELVNQWITAWTSKDIEAYGNCYASDFRFRNQDLDAWLRKKRRLSKKYKYIKVRKEDLVIKRGRQTSIATFTQYYESSGYRAVGKKKLLLKQEDGQWKIYRETWKKI